MNYLFSIDEEASKTYVRIDYVKDLLNDITYLRNKNSIDVELDIIIETLKNVSDNNFINYDNAGKYFENLYHHVVYVFRNCQNIDTLNKIIEIFKLQQIIDVKFYRYEESQINALNKNGFTAADGCVNNKMFFNLLEQNFKIVSPLRDKKKKETAEKKAAAIESTKQKLSNMSQDDFNKEALEAVDNNKLSNLKKLVKTGYNVNSEIKRNGSSSILLLTRAIEKNHYNIAEYLIQQGVNVNATNDYNNTALHAAVQCRRAECIELLLKSGADATIKNYKNVSVENEIKFYKNAN